MSNIYKFNPIDLVGRRLNCFSYGLSIVLVYAQNGHFPRRHKYTNYFVQFSQHHSYIF